MITKLEEKIKWMEENGFAKMYTSSETFAFSYKGRIVNENDIKNRSLDQIKVFKVCCDNN